MTNLFYFIIQSFLVCLRISSETRSLISIHSSNFSQMNQWKWWWLPPFWIDSRDPIILDLCEKARLRNHDKTIYNSKTWKRKLFLNKSFDRESFHHANIFPRIWQFVKYLIFVNRNRWSKNFSESSSKILCRSCPLWSFSLKINSDRISCDYLDVLSKVSWIEKCDEALWSKHLSPCMKFK